MVQGRLDQTHRPRPVREDLIPKTTGRDRLSPRLDSPFVPAGFNGAHMRIAAAPNWPVGNDSLFNGRLATVSVFHTFSAKGRKQRKETYGMATTANRWNTTVKEAMTKSQLLEALSESTGLQRKDVASLRLSPLLSS